jgi:23S rRNA (cytosine1962-C5)-methyltransferase
LTDLLQPRGILARNDPKARALDGLEQRVDVLAGDVPEAVTVTETGIEYEVDLRRGQKTGLFLDQRENRAAAAAYARGRMLDCFSYNGGFALVMGRRCTETIAFDVSEDAVARIRQNAAATASPSTRAWATSSTSCAGSIASASGSTRSCSTRRRSPRTRRR